jgi:ABC-type hemin transport system substrate-binding protein
MYGRNKPDQTQSSSDKNPNRVTGGLKAQGVDTMVMISEDGTKQELPTLEYVRSLEEQSKKQRAAITVLERKLTRLDTAFQHLQNSINRS